MDALAYAKALESLTGVEMSKMLPIPNIGKAVFPEARRFMDQGSHLKLYRFSPEDYCEAGSIWNGAAPKAYTEGLGGSDRLEFVDAPPAGGDLAHLAGIASSFCAKLCSRRNLRNRHQTLQESKEPVSW